MKRIALTLAAAVAIVLAVGGARPVFDVAAGHPSLFEREAS